MTALDTEITETDALIESRFRDHPHAEAILSMPGIGPVLGAEFIAYTSGDMSVFGSPDRLAGVAGVAGRDADEEGQSVRVRQDVHLGTRLAAVHGARTCVFAPFTGARRSR